MKKLLLFVFVLALLSGCATWTEMMAEPIRSEGILNTHAYVIGKSLAQDFSFTREGEGRFSSDPAKTFSVAKGPYRVRKVLPGVYHAKSAFAGSSTLSANGRALFSVSLAPGKITYIGDIRLLVTGGATPPPPNMPDPFPGRLQSVSFSKDVQNNSEAAKNALREMFPELAGELDSLFVYRPAQ